MVEKNTLLAPWDFRGYSPGVFLYNRVLWTAVGATTLIALWRFFPLSVEALTARSQGKRAAKARLQEEEVARPIRSLVAAELPRVRQVFGAGTPHQQAATNILRVRIGDPQFSAASLHVLAIAARHRLIEPQGAQMYDQLPALDGADGRHSGDFADFDAVAINLRNGRVVRDAEEHPSFQHTRQLFAAALEGFGISPDAGNRRYFAVERPIILDNFVSGMPHGSPDIRREHNRLSHSLGNVGIGTTNPQHWLHVAWTIAAEEAIAGCKGADDRHRFAASHAPLPPCSRPAVARRLRRFRLTQCSPRSC